MGQNEKFGRVSKQTRYWRPSKGSRLDLSIQSIFREYNRVLISKEKKGQFLSRFPSEVMLKGSLSSLLSLLVIQKSDLQKKWEIGRLFFLVAKKRLWNDRKSIWVCPRLSKKANLKSYLLHRKRSLWQFDWPLLSPWSIPLLCTLARHGRLSQIASSAPGPRGRKTAWDKAPLVVTPAPSKLKINFGACKAYRMIGCLSNQSCTNFGNTCFLLTRVRNLCVYPKASLKLHSPDNASHPGSTIRPPRAFPSWSCY